MRPLTRSEAFRLALGGCLAIAAAIGIGRFVYTPMLPIMIDALGWSRFDGGLVASANFLGYVIGALVAGHRIFSAMPRRWLLIALAISVMSTAGMAASPQMAVLVGLRFVGGIASAFVIICASTLVLERLSRAGQAKLASVHFAGVGIGIFISAAVVAAMSAAGDLWQSMWLMSAGAAAFAAVVAAVLVRPSLNADAALPAPSVRSGGSQAGIVLAYGLFGFGYVITATFLVTIVRQTAEIRALEPWIWMLFGLAAVPSVPLWQWLSRRIGLARAFAVACLVEAVGVAASVEWMTTAGVCASAVLLGGTFMGLTALGLMAGRAIAGERAQRVIGLMTASFGIGQMIGPTIAGALAEATGNLRAPSLLAAAALVIAAAIALVEAGRVGNVALRAAN